MAIQKTEPTTASSFAVTRISVTDKLKAYVDLTKPRIMILLVYTALSGMIVALHHLPSFGILIATLVGLILSTGGSAALNMWYDRDIDVMMKRTQRRPIPMGLVKSQHALVYGISLIVASFVELLVLVNWVAAVLAVAGAVYYVLIYTMWLKRRTPQNIVIGGGAGAIPPLIGAAAVTGHVPMSGIVLFLIIFFWTPPHFWSLALYKNEEYQRANIPMMPVVRGERYTKWQSTLYAVALLGISSLLPLVTKVSWVYWPISLALGLGFLVYLVKTQLEPTGTYTFARKSFFYSLMYLSALFLVAPVACLI